MWLDISGLARWHVGLVAALIMLLDNQQLRLRLCFDTELHFYIAESISPSWICAETRVFLNIVLLLHTKGTDKTCQISSIGSCDFFLFFCKNFPSHSLFKHTSAFIDDLLLGHTWCSNQVDLIICDLIFKSLNLEMVLQQKQKTCLTCRCLFFSRHHRRSWFNYPFIQLHKTR